MKTRKPVLTKMMIQKLRFHYGNDNKIFVLPVFLFVMNVVDDD